MGSVDVTVVDVTSRFVTVPARLWLTAAQDRLVPEGDPDCAFFYSQPGQRIPHADAVRYGLIPGDAPSEPVDGWDLDIDEAAALEDPPEPEQEPQPEPVTITFGGDPEPDPEPEHAPAPKPKRGRPPKAKG